MIVLKPIIYFYSNPTRTRGNTMFYTYTKEEYDALDEDEKEKCRIPLMSGGNPYAVGNFIFQNKVDAGLYTITSYGVRLFLKTEQLAKYCGEQFFDIWINFLFK